MAAPALDAALVYCGIPPELPNSSQLTGMGADYVAAYLEAQAHIPQHATRAAITEAADGTRKTPEQAGGAILWPDPAHQYRPAYVEIEVSNPSKTAPADNLETYFKKSIRIFDGSQNQLFRASANWFASGPVANEMN